MTSFMRFRGVLALAMLQAVPVSTEQATILGVGGGGGWLEVTRFSCEGTGIDQKRVPYRFGGVDVDHWLTDQVNLKAVLGNLSSSDSAVALGFVGGALLSFETEQYALGFGFKQQPHLFPYHVGVESNVQWSGHLRAGHAEGFHLRADVAPPDLLASSELQRLAVGWGRVGGSRPSGYLGLAHLMRGVDGFPAAGLVGELTLPITGRTSFTLHGFTTRVKDSPTQGVGARLNMRVR